MERLDGSAIGYVWAYFRLLTLSEGFIKQISENTEAEVRTTNALRTFGKKAGILTLLGDCLKCVAAIVLVRVFLGKTYGDFPLWSVCGGGLYSGT